MDADEAAKERANDAAKKQADEIAREKADEVAKEAATEAYNEAYRDAYDDTYRRVYDDAYRSAYELACAEEGLTIQQSGGLRRNAKLSPEQVSEICRLYEDGHCTQVELADRYGVTQQSISYIVNRPRGTDT